MTLKETMRKYFLLFVEMTAKSDEGSHHWSSNCGKLFRLTVKIEDTVMFYWHWAKNNMMFTHPLQMFSILLQQSWDLTAVCPLLSVTPLACRVMQRKLSQCSFWTIYRELPFSSNNLTLMELGRLTNKNFLWRLVSGVTFYFSSATLDTKVNNVKKLICNSFGLINTDKTYYEFEIIAIIVVKYSSKNGWYLWRMNYISNSMTIQLFTSELWAQIEHCVLVQG